MSDADIVWLDWLRIPGEAEMYAEYGTEYRKDMERTFAYAGHRISYEIWQLWKSLGVTWPRARFTTSDPARLAAAFRKDGWDEIAGLIDGTGNLEDE